MEDPSYITKPPKRGMGRQDGPGTRQGTPRDTSTSGTTTEARKVSENIDLGGVGKKAIKALFAQGGFLNRKGSLKLKYPLHNEVNHPAKIRFTAYTANAYTIDPKAIAEVWDVPLLGWGSDKAMTLKEGREEQQETEHEERLNVPDELSGVQMSGSVGRTATVGGPPNRNFTKDAAGDKARQQMEKEQEAKNDAIKGANIPDTTNIQAKPAAGIPTIELYFPQSLTFNDDVNYNQVDLGPAGLAGMAALNNGCLLYTSDAADEP